MKKILLALMCIFTVGVLSSCGGDPVKRLNKLQEKIEKNSDDYKIDDWVDVMKEVMAIQYDFYKSNPSQEEMDDYQEAIDDFGKACRKSETSDKMWKAAKRLDEDEDFREKVKEMEDLQSEVRKKLREGKD